MVMASGLTCWGSVPAVMLFMGNPAHAAARIVFEEIEVEASVEAVFDACMEAWAGEARPTEEPSRGAACGKVLAYEPGGLLTLQWLMPQEIESIARHRTVLTLTFERRGRATRLSLTHSGFGKGQDWDRALAFFSCGWPQALSVLKTMLEAGTRARH